MAQKQPIAEYTKDGVTKRAWTPAECVDLEFAGWSRKNAKPRRPAAKKAAPKKTAAKKAPAKAAAPAQHTSESSQTAPATSE